MKNFLLFSCCSYEGGCGWNDFKGDFNSIEDALEQLHELRLGSPFNHGWWNIVDLTTGKIVKEDSD